METTALTGIASHCDTENPYWWVIPALFVAAILIRSVYRRISDARWERRADEGIRRAMTARLDDQDRF